MKGSNGAHPAHLDLAVVFSSIALLGPRMSEELVRLVAHLFTPEEAEVVKHLPFYVPRSLKAIARKAGRPAAEIKPLLEAAGERRTIYGGSRGYCLMPIIPGMFEYLLMGGADTPWHREYAKRLQAVIHTGYMREYMSRSIPAVRNIPVQTALPDRNRVVDADLVSEMIRAHEHLAVLHVCQCRQAAHFTGGKCRRSAPSDGCLVFGSFAQGAVAGGNGRPVSREEMHAIVEERRKRNLVFLAANVSPTSPNAICTCCDCCCHFLGAVNRYEGRALMAEPRDLAEVREDLCNDCGKCSRVCNTYAHRMEAGRHVYEARKCIGCGVCLEACPEQAIRIVGNPRYRKPAAGYPTLGLKLFPPLALSGLKAKIRR